MILLDKYISPVLRDFKIDGRNLKIPVYGFPAVVVGSGAAGFNAADLLAQGGVSVAVVTEGINMGTSRNTGSDKQTYYKLTLSGDAPDSVEDMAKSLFDGGGMDGDIALCEAAGSVRGFMRLAGLGVPFPYNDYGEFAGYRTDHDTRTRATSCGPLTSKYMTEALEKSVRSRHIPIFDGYRVFKILTDTEKAVGLAAFCPETAGIYNEFGLVFFRADYIVWAAGGPSAIYAATVYPESQTCSHGVPLEAGVTAVNVTESQYGLASVKFRWNLSGTYQQVLPRYYSTAADGQSDEREFLTPVFASVSKMLTAVFKKGYQWPFDPAKLDTATANDSSLVDIAVFRERQSGRRVFMDFRRNFSEADTNGKLDFSLLEDEPKHYLENSGALLGTPIERLAKMNAPAIELYQSHGIDLSREPLEIDMSAQHNNGGFAVNTDYESISLSHFYVVGEAAGVFGIHRPGGSALNSTQVSSQRAAGAILSKLRHHAAEEADIPECLNGFVLIAMNGDALNRDKILRLRRQYAERMTECGAFIRDEKKIAEAIRYVRHELSVFDRYETETPELLPELAINRDILLTQYVYLSAIREYIKKGGKSRGSYLIVSADAKLPDGKKTVDIDTDHRNRVCEVTLAPDRAVAFAWRNVRPIPPRDNWFENVYNAFRAKM